jgi:hypothetical protein
VPPGTAAAAPRVVTTKPGQRLRLRLINVGSDTALPEMLRRRGRSPGRHHVRQSLIHQASTLKTCWLPWTKMMRHAARPRPYRRDGGLGRAGDQLPVFGGVLCFGGGCWAEAYPQPLATYHEQTGGGAFGRDRQA